METERGAAGIKEDYLGKGEHVGILSRVSGNVRPPASERPSRVNTALPQSVATAKLLELTRDFLRTFPYRRAGRAIQFPVFLRNACLSAVYRGERERGSFRGNEG